MPPENLIQVLQRFMDESDHPNSDQDGVSFFQDLTFLCHLQDSDPSQRISDMNHRIKTTELLRLRTPLKPSAPSSCHCSTVPFST